MELSKFIADTLTEIVVGVTEAQGRVVSQGAIIVPEIIKNTIDNRMQTHDHRDVDFVEFELGLTIIEGEGLNARVNIFAIGAGATTKDETTTINRIKFRASIVGWATLG